jgi:hypothetical protein
VTAFQKAHLVGETYIKAGTMQIAMSDFRATGILPYNPDIFTESDFLASARQQEAANEEDNINQGTLVSPGDTVQVSRINEPVPSTSHRGRRRGSAALLTSSPYKSTLTESLEKKKVLPAKTKLILSPVNRSKCGKAAPNKKLISREANMNLHRTVLLMIKNRHMFRLNSDSDDNGDDAQCPFCHGLFSSDNKGETWIQCTKCFQWEHERCDKRKERAPKYICISCLNN